MRGLPLLLPLLLALSCSDRDAPKPVPVTDEAAPATLPGPGAAPVPGAAAADPDDPAEPGISDLARLARYVFKAMQRHDGVCPFANPLADRLHFALALEVKGGRMTKVGLAHVTVEPTGASEARPLGEAQWPRELTAYVECMAPHLEAVAMDPAPADGSYEPVYAYGGRRDAQP
jgi:hypothetical protein